MPKTEISQQATNITHYSANCNIIGSWITTKHCCYVLCCVCHLELISTDPFFLKASIGTSRSREILHETVSAPEMPHFSPRWFKHGLYLLLLFLLCVCADCSGLRFPRAMLCGWTRTSPMLSVFFFLHDDVVTWSDWAINRCDMRKKEKSASTQNRLFLTLFHIKDQFLAT